MRSKIVFGKMLSNERWQSYGPLSTKCSQKREMEKFFYFLDNFEVGDLRTLQALMIGVIIRA